MAPAAIFGLRLFLTMLVSLLPTVQSDCILQPDGAGHVAVPAGVSLGSYPCCGNGAFSTCVNPLRSFSLPPTLTRIGNGTFLLARSLTQAILPATVTSVGPWAFRECTALTTLTFGAGVTRIPAEACLGCAALSSLSMGNSVTIIDHHAFSLTALVSLALPNAVTLIEARAFEQVPLRNVEIPIGVSFGTTVFALGVCAVGLFQPGAVLCNCAVGSCAPTAALPGPPITQAPVSQPPVTQAPVTQAPVTQTPTLQPIRSPTAHPTDTPTAAPTESPAAVTGGTQSPASPTRAPAGGTATSAADQSGSGGGSPAWVVPLGVGIAGLAIAVCIALFCRHQRSANKEAGAGAISHNPIFTANLEPLDRAPPPGVVPPANRAPAVRPLSFAQGKTDPVGESGRYEEAERGFSEPGYAVAAERRPSTSLDTDRYVAQEDAAGVMQGENAYEHPYCALPTPVYATGTPSGQQYATLQRPGKVGGAAQNVGPTYATVTH
eukprot:m.475703 g.475703  ORF g.475703 m.475703 type:complete len:492 (+) comp38933_c0_seq1:189-1664(+)